MNPATPIIRDARPGDLDFIVSANASLAEETEAKALDLDTLRSGVRRALIDPARLRYWIAVLDDRPIGQAAVTREWSDWRDGWIWWFQSVYVLPEARRLGVFRALHSRIRSAARRDPDVIGLRLYVEEHNRRAQETYRSMEMAPSGYLVFEELWPRSDAVVNPSDA